MAHFTRFDIAEAHYLFARHYHQGGDTPRRDFERLHRIHFSPGLALRTHDDPALALSENGAEIYAELVYRWGINNPDAPGEHLPCGHIVGQEDGRCCGQAAPRCDDPGAHGPGCQCDGGEPVL